jgi:hypothetical protein
MALLQRGGSLALLGCLLILGFPTSAYAAAQPQFPTTAEVGTSGVAASQPGEGRDDAVADAEVDILSAGNNDSCPPPRQVPLDV